MSALLATMDWFPLILSLKVAAVATLLAAIAGIALGWVFARKTFPGSGVFMNRLPGMRIRRFVAAGCGSTVLSSIAPTSTTTFATNNAIAVPNGTRIGRPELSVGLVR